MRPKTTLRAAFDSPQLLGKLMGGPTREAMRSVLLASQGERLTPSELEHFKRLTGREEALTERVDECHVIGGRRSGKSSGIAALAIYASCLCDYSDKLAVGERAVVLVIAENQKQARIVFRYIEGGIDASPVLSKLVVGRTASSLALNNNVSIEVHSADFRSIRGMTLAMCIIDEIAFLRNENSANPDHEICDAVRPGLVTLGGQMHSIGSPYAKRGVQYDMFRRHYGPNGDPHILVARGSTRDFNASFAEHH